MTQSQEPTPSARSTRALSRRHFLTAGIGGTAAMLFGGYELVNHGVLPGKALLEQIDGACKVPQPALTFSSLGAVHEGQFFSKARGLQVGYQIAYPPGHGPGSELPLGIAMHGFGGDHNSGLGDVTLVQALAAKQDGKPLPLMALAQADGGGLYWNKHPGDNPMAMLVDELIPMCQKLGLGRRKGSIGSTGISMGGYGSILIAEQHPNVIAAVASISPAIWTSYEQAKAVNPGAYASAADFARDDAITHTAALKGKPVRVASGNDDPFHPGVLALAKALPSSATVVLSAGCHTGSFFGSQQHASLQFLAEHLSSE